jgi:hypothetical protein
LGNEDVGGRYDSDKSLEAVALSLNYGDERKTKMELETEGSYTHGFHAVQHYSSGWIYSVIISSETYNLPKQTIAKILRRVVDLSLPNHRILLIATSGLESWARHCFGKSPSNWDIATPSMILRLNNRGHN